MGVFPSDHVIGKTAAYRAVVRAALARPPAPGTSDGGGDPAALAGDRLRLRRISARARSRAPKPVAVRRFHEKPELRQGRDATSRPGNFYWNSGMFFWRTDVLLDQLRQHLPKTATILAALPPFGSRRFRRAA